MIGNEGTPGRRLLSRGARIDEDTPLSVAAPGVLANDTDPVGDTLSAVLVAGPAHGTLAPNANGSFTYLPAANYNGPHSFTYKASDGSDEEIGPGPPSPEKEGEGVF